MIGPPELAAVVVLALIATTIQTSIGFGTAVFFVPLGTLVVGPEPSVATMLIVVPGTAAILFGSSSEQTQWSESTWPAAISVASMPVGVFLLTTADESVLRLLIGLAVLLAVGINYMSGRGGEVLHPSSWWRMTLASLGAGLMRGSVGMGGPAMVLYYHWRGGGATRFRNRMYAYGLLAGGPGVLVALVGGIYNSETLPVVAASLPGALLGILVGTRVRPLITDSGIRRVTLVMLAATSFAAILTAASGLV